MVMKVGQVRAGAMSMAVAAPMRRALARSWSTSSGTLELLQQVASGQVTPEAAAAQCRLFEYESVDVFAKIDTRRWARTGFPEVVYAEGKTTEQVVAILRLMQQKQPEATVMATRVTTAAAEEILSHVPEFTYHEQARIIGPSVDQVERVDSQVSIDACRSLAVKRMLKLIFGRVSVLCAGTSDLPVAEEAALTLELAGFEVTRLYDVGVAGIHRLLRNQHVLAKSDVVIAVAGMDGALPGVVVSGYRAVVITPTLIKALTIISLYQGGLTAAPVIAVPTSVGYGAAFGGLAPLLTMLNACSPGVGVVNIDNGFGAAVLAELEKWRRQLIMEVEDYHSNEQLKRIAEFGRVNAALLEEAKAHVRSVELQLRQQLELEVARIRQSAQEQLRAMQRENELLRAQLVAMRAAAEDTQPDSPMMSVCDSDEPSATTESGVEDV
ncbi:TPA: hypothetical protein N0F65_005155 [Lagenidium giganteum]|uniref:phosphoribosylaminoimidazole carboxylase n=1 Tax=Lagenidium giganteum TaxID=4803 RepID=A0AAV2YTI9_9STRA|nr:TPA: hypothetical protein N0F65_005155 [Lagenidium giganteum]